MTNGTDVLPSTAQVADRLAMQDVLHLHSRALNRRDDLVYDRDHRRHR